MAEDLVFRALKGKQMKRNKSYPIFLTAILMALFALGLFSGQSILGLLDGMIARFSELLADLDNSCQVAQVANSSSTENCFTTKSANDNFQP